MTSSNKKSSWIEGITSSQVERSLADTQTSSIHRQAVRRGLVATNIGLMVTMLWASQVWPDQWRSIFDLLLFAGMGTIYLALRKSVRHLSDAPNDMLDERQIMIRDAAYITSYRLLSAVTITTFALLTILIPISLDNAWLALYVSYLMFSIGLPAMVLAWNLPDEVVEEGR
jgi:hypothetical protein